MANGKLVVLEGIDGSGKSTQYRMLCEKLNSNSIEYKKIVFPRYNEESSALIRMYLGGAFGSEPEDVNAYTASTFYAVDRFASFKSDWGKYYSDGGLVISDRYTTSNAVHQGSKMLDGDINTFFSWLSDFEYKKIGLPCPDLVIYLDVDLQTSLDRMSIRQQSTNTKADIHEKNTEYLKKCLTAAQRAADYYGWKKIPSVKDGKLRTMEEINGDIYSIITDIIR